MPSTVAEHQHEWDELHCTCCGEAFAAAVSFDRDRLGVPLICDGCSDWHLISCARCRRPVGAARGGARHRGPVVYCRSCAHNDLQAAERRREREAQESQPIAIVDPGANGEADSEAFP